MAFWRRRAAALGGAAALAAVGVLAWACEPWRRPRPPGPGWSPGPAVPAPRGEVAAAATEREIILIGGLAGSGGSTGRVDILDVAGGTWRAGPALPVPLNHAAAAALGNRVFLAGGSEQFGRPPRREAYALDLAAGPVDPAAARWQPIAPMPAGRWAAGMAAAGGRVFVVGGTDGGGAAESPAAVFAYDPLADRWDQQAPLAAPREHLGVAAAGGAIYAVGGRWAGRNLATVEAYEPAANRWRPLPALAVPRSGLGVAAVQAGGRWFLVAAGGEHPGVPGRVFADAEVFDVAAQAWRRIPPLPTPRHGLGAATVGDAAYFIAGATLPGARSVLGWSGAVEGYRVEPPR